MFISSLSSALPNPKPWGVRPIAAILSDFIAFLSFAAERYALIAEITLSSSGAPKHHIKGLSLKALRAFAALYAPVSELDLSLPPSITGSLSVQSSIGTLKVLSTSDMYAPLANVMF